jgi:hypothetical protein
LSKTSTTSTGARDAHGAEEAPTEHPKGVVSMEGVATTTTSETTVRLAVGISLVSLFLSGWSFISSLDEDGFERSVEQRLACLELPGPNDCGLDGR